MNNRLLRVAVVLLSSAMVWAQAPVTLKTLTATYELQRSTLTNTFEAQVKPARDRYLAALTAAQKAALAATRTADLAAIGAEIEAVNIGTLPEAAPPDLPRTLLQGRRAAATALANATRMLVPRQRDLALNYQRSLIALEDAARKANDQAQLAAIAAEKQRALGEVESAGGGQKNRNVVENGDFSKPAGGGFPTGWTKAHGWKDVSDATVVSEGRDRFLRFRRLQANNQSDLKPDKVIPIPARARYAEVTFRMRVEGLVKGKEFDPWPGMHISARDAADENLAKEEAVMKSDSSWKRMSARVQLPSETKSLSVSLGPFGSAGIVDFDDVTVEFK
jgi:hypothetical protein